MVGKLYLYTVSVHTIIHALPSSRIFKLILIQFVSPKLNLVRKGSVNKRTFKTK